MTKTTHEVSQAFFTIRSMIKFSTIAYVVVGVILGYITGAYVAALWQDSSHISIHRLVCAIVGGCAGYLLVTAKMMVVKLLLIIAENTQ